ncbi:hypothetical protein BGZ95_008399 [Linnemannia exigua]|uniref:Uncharacterized protein n=1 Tax=Linnemannia exigua TaxID=604196 RepID=A0AAD4DGA9_9FUNG|nr:hypothetical protein BGZ95_008399 [Linnemannia exigua]
MGSTLDNFDTLCQQVFLPSHNVNENADPAQTTSVQETALSLLSRAQIYELPTPLESATSATLITTTTVESTAHNDKQYYRIHLEELKDPQQQQKVRDILVQAIGPSALVVLPYDRNLSGYSSKTRTEATEAPLETPVVLDMGGLSSAESAAPVIGSSSIADSKTSDDIDNATSKTMLLVSVKEWLGLTGRIRFWRAESHRVKAAQREVVLDRLLEERWKTATSSALPSTPISSPPQSSGSLTAAALTPRTLPSSAVSTPSTATSSPSSVPTSPLVSAMPPSLTKLSTFKQPFQEHQLESLVQFLTAYGDEPSATSILRGLLDLTRRQLSESAVLSWTFDRANLTEQKPEVTVAFLDLIAQLGLELVNPSLLATGKQQESGHSSYQHVSVKPAAPTTTASYTSTASDATVVGTPKPATPVQSTDLTWTFGSRIDDRRLEYWIHHLQQGALPVAKVDHQSLLPSTASFAPTNNSATATSPASGSEQKPNPVPLTIRKRFLQDRHTIPAGTIQPLTSPHTNTDTNTSTYAKSDTPSNNAIVRDSTFVLATSKYALSSSSPSSGGQGSGLFVNRVKKDVKDLARWASTCGSRLDWIWAWLFSSFQKSRREAKSASRKARPHDENV